MQSGDPEPQEEAATPGLSTPGVTTRSQARARIERAPFIRDLSLQFCQNQRHSAQQMMNPDPLISPTGNRTENAVTNPNQQAHQVTINGLTLQVAQEAQVTANGSLVLYKKEERKNLTEEKRHDLFDKFTKGGQLNHGEKFHLLDTSAKELENLEENYHLHSILQGMKTTFEKYDMLDVFTVIYPKKDARGKITPELLMVTDSKPKTSDLFLSYSNVTLQDVAESTAWYRQFVQGAEFINDNLSLSYDFLRNNSDSILWDKIQEELSKFDPNIEVGGPLAFKCMMNLLQNNSRLVVTQLQSQLKGLRIDDYPGEDVSTLVGHLRAILSRLRSLEFKDENGRILTETVPHDLSKTLLELFQTSSTEKFNEIFKVEAAQAFRRSIIEGDKAYGDPDSILEEANQVYRAIFTSDEDWLGKNAKGRESVFQVVSFNGCHNCGGDHKLDQCPKPQDERKIQENRHSFFDQNCKKGSGSRGGRGRGSGRSGFGRGGRGGRGKGHFGSRYNGRGRGSTAGPKPNTPTIDLPRPKKGESNRKTVDGKEYWFKFKDNTWYECDKPAASALHSESVSEHHQQVPTQSNIGPSDESKAIVQAMINSINVALADTVKKFS